MRDIKNAIDVARYIINYCSDKDILISNLKLQKLLYLAQSFSLTTGNVPIFKEDIEAWDFGPVVPSVYNEFKMFGGCSIHRIDYYYDKVFNHDTFLQKVEVTTDIFDDFEKTIMETVVDSFAKMGPTDLVELVQSQDPWKNTWKKGERRIITHESMKKYFVD